jgi:hypothetical protein
MAVPGGHPAGSRPRRSRPESGREGSCDGDPAPQTATSGRLAPPSARSPGACRPAPRPVTARQSRNVFIRSGCHVRGDASDARRSIDRVCHGQPRVRDRRRRNRRGRLAPYLLLSPTIRPSAPAADRRYALIARTPTDLVPNPSGRRAGAGRIEFELHDPVDTARTDHTDDTDGHDHNTTA